LFNQMLEADIEIFAGLKQFIVGGDALSPMHINQLRRRYPELKIVNGYGPTENTTFTATFSIEQEYNEPIPIGAPITNTVIYILDRNRQLVPVGVPGELCTGGDGVARGYMNNPDYTAEKFIPNPFRTNDRLYLTGDLARWRRDGFIDFLGRIDTQVKIRGIRMELGEIETQLLQFEQIVDAVVLARTGSTGDKYLCAYVVVKDKDGIHETEAHNVGGTDFSEIKKELAKNLPDYMIPTHLVSMPELPLTPNGKVDRRALPEPELTAGENYIPPSSPIQLELTRIWAEVLDVKAEAISMDDNFFELGGHSLKATVLTSRIHKALDVKIPVAEIFNHQTIMELSHYLGAAKQETFVQIPPAEPRDYYPLSSAQMRLFILQQMTASPTGYNIPGTIVLDKSVDLERLKAAFAAMCRRHESFRTGFEMVEGVPMQKIHPQVQLHLETYHLESDAPHLLESVAAEFVRPFDLSVPPLLRMGTVSTPNNLVLLLDMHHIITDGTSYEILKKEFYNLYEGRTLPPLRLQYKDYAVWRSLPEQAAAIKGQEAFWLNEFSDELPVLQMYTDHPRPAARSFAGNTVMFPLTDRESRTLKSIAQESGCTGFMVLLAVYNVWLSRLSGQEDIVVGTPIAGRGHADLQQIVGMFVNTLALRNAPRGDLSFGEFLARLKQRTVAAFDNQDYQFEDLVEKPALVRDVSRNPMFDVMFSYLDRADESGDPVSVPAGDAYVHKPGRSKFDMTLTAADMGRGVRTDGKSGFILYLDYCSKLFEPATIDRYLNYFRAILAALAEGIDIPIADIQILPTDEKEQLLAAGSAVPFPTDPTLHALVARQAQKTPDANALVGCERRGEEPLLLSYSQLENAAAQTARLLMDAGVQPGTIVALMLDRSVEMIVSILGVMKAGAAYLPLDPDSPAQRVDYMLRDGNIAFMISNRTDGTASETCTVLAPLCPEQYADDFPEPRLPDVTAEAPAYVIYTSGSTGRPKGVVVEHRNAVNTVSWWADTYAVNEASHVLMMSDYTFDPSVNQMFAPLMRGGRLFLIDRETLYDIPALRAFMQDHGITIVNFVPALLDQLLGCGQKIESVRTVLTGGERLDEAVKDRILNKGYALFNQYGPTETTIDALTGPCDQGKVTLGKPIANTRCFIVDAYNNLTPVGVPGELLIAGAGLARGYLNRPELTSERFPEPETEQSFGTHKSYRTYKTGDLCRRLPDGNYEFLGRMDHQVKIRGYRIELGEIEAQLSAHPQIKESVLTAREDRQGVKSLCAYIVSSADVEHIDAYLTERLPAYMVPAHYVLLAEIPRTATGKIDRRALPEPQLTAGDDYAAPQDELEKELVQIWAQLLDLESDVISIHAGFFKLGGHSLKATMLAAQVERRLGVKIPLTRLFSHPTVAGTAQFIRWYKQLGIAVQDDQLVLLKQGTAGHLFFFHGGTGEIEEYVNLSALLNTNDHCWGIRAEHMDQLSPRNRTVPQMAHQYLQKIKKVQAAGPYTLIGWSAGGVIAHEAALQLEKAGEKVATLVLMDTYLYTQAGDQTEFSLSGELNFLRSLPGGAEPLIRYLEETGDLTLDNLWTKTADYFETHPQQHVFIDDALAAFNLKQLLPRSGQMSLRDKFRFVAFIRTLNRSLQLYQPQAVAPVRFIKAAEIIDTPAAGQKRWDQVHQSVGVVEVPGNHFTMLAAPTVQSTAAALDALLGDYLNMT